MKKVNERFRCPNCAATIVKDSTLIHLSSGTRFADLTTGRQMSAQGGYKEIMYCARCNGPLKMKALIEGRFDVPDHSIAYLMVWIGLMIGLMAGLNSLWWFAFVVVTPALTSWHYLVGRRFLLRRIRRHNV